MTERHAETNRQTGLGYACAASGVLGAAAGIFALAYPAHVDDHIWSYPFPFGLFVGFSLVLALTHLLALAGFVGLREVVGQRGGPAAMGWLWAAIIGFVLLAGCEVASGSIGRSDIDSGTAKAVGGGFGISSMLVALGSIVVGVVLLRKAWSALGAWSLVASGLIIIALVTPAAIAQNDTLRVAALVAWSLCFIPLGLVIARTIADRAPEVVRASPGYSAS